MNRFKPFRRFKLKKRIKIGVLLICAGCLVLVLSLDHSIRPILLQHAQARAKIYANTILNQVVYRILQEKELKYNQLVHITRQEDNSVSLVEIDSVQVNALKTDVVNQVQNKVASSSAISVYIPIGTLSGSEYLIGRGPALHFSLELSAAVKANLKSRFISAGVNQTLHRITMPVTAQLYLMMPLYKTGCEITNDFLIAETVIVGKIPEAYTNVVETPSDDIAGILFDYSAEVS